jgi:hypothetical protein
VIIPSYQPYTIDLGDVVEIWESNYVISKAGQQARWDVNQLASLVNNLQEQVTTPEKKDELSRRITLSVQIN